MKRLYFYFLDKFSSLISTLKKRELNSNGIKINTEKQEYKFHHNSNLKITKSILIIIVFSLIGVFAKNSTEPIHVFGFDVIVWKFAITLSFVIASSSIYQFITHKSPKIIVNNSGIRIKHIGFFNWKKISQLMIEVEYDSEGSGINYNMALKCGKVWYRTYIDEMNMKKEDIEAVLDYFWRKHKYKK